MSSTFFGIEIAKRGILAQKLAEEIVSHNIVNSNTPGYTRQRAELYATLPFPAPTYNREQMPGQMGTGVAIEYISGLRDKWLENRIKVGISSYSYAAELNKRLNELQSIFNELSSPNLGDAISSFWNSINDIANNPDSMAVRQVLVSAADTMTGTFRFLNDKMSSMARELNMNFSSEIDVVNSLAENINSVNMDIFRAISLGYNPNDLIDRRNTLLNELSKYTDFAVTELKNGMIKVEINGHLLIGENFVMKLSVVPDNLNPGNIKAIFSDGADAVFSSGSLKAIIDMRDIYLPQYKTAIDSLAQTIISSVNQLHASGYALNSSTPSGLPLFNGSGMSDIVLNPTIRADVSLFAAASNPNAPGDGTNALAISGLKYNLLMANNTMTINEFYSALISRMGNDIVSISESESIYKNYNKNLENQRQSLSGVSLDEEMTELIKFQHAFEANIKVMKVQDEILESIINMIK